MLLKFDSVYAFVFYDVLLLNHLKRSHPIDVARVLPPMNSYVQGERFKSVKINLKCGLSFKK